jgi:hypothetical protein
LNQEIDNSIDPGVSGVLFLMEKRDGGTQGRSFFFEKTEGVKKHDSIDPGVSVGLFLAEKRDGGTTGVVLSKVEVGEVFSRKKPMG